MSYKILSTYPFLGRQNDGGLTETAAAAAVGAGGSLAVFVATSGPSGCNPSAGMHMATNELYVGRSMSMISEPPSRLKSCADLVISISFPSKMSLPLFGGMMRQWLHSRCCGDRIRSGAQAWW